MARRCEVSDPIPDHSAGGSRHLTSSRAQRADQCSDRPTGETIPIRLFLGGFELTPTFRDVNKKFSTRYYLNLVLIDEENRRYFK